MEEIDEKDAAKLVSLIYGPVINEDNNLLEERTVEKLIEKIEERIKDKNSSDKIGAEMSKAEYQDVINQIKSSETLMSMKITGFENDENTYFRAMTLTDPNHKVKPVVVYRGTAGDYEWDDNFSAMVSSRTPSQQRAQQYIVQSGYDHLTVAGHSKGGNLAASTIYLLPEGMVDKVYSFDGQGVSNLFLDDISDEKIDFSKERVFNINEFRDIVSQLMNKTGSDKNSTYFDSGVDFKDTDYGFFDFKMYLFHPHKPNYFLSKDAKDMGRAFVPAKIAHYITKLDVNSWSKDKALWTLQKISGLLKTGDGTEWSEKLWDTVYEAEKMYKRVNEKRGYAILKKLFELYGKDLSQFDLVQEEGSIVVDGAILTCPYCSGIGDLENIEDHGLIIQGKPAASKEDNKEENISMKDLDCSLIDFSKAPEAKERICEPEIWFEWVITDPDKTLEINGKNVEAVLKKSVLGCFRGGMIEVVHNGQMSTEKGVKKTSQLNNNKNKKDSIWKKLGNGINGAADLGGDLWETGSNLISHGGTTIVEQFQKLGEGMNQLSEKVVEETNKATEKIADGINQISDDIIQGSNDVADKISDSINQISDNVNQKYDEAAKYIEEILQNKLNFN